MRMAMPEVKTCPMKYNILTCTRELCAWWNKDAEQCSVTVIAITLVALMKEDSNASSR